MTDFLQPFSAVAGSRQPKIVFVGEAWGETEDKYHTPFAGASGKELFTMFGEAWPEVDPKTHAFVKSCMYTKHGDKLWLEAREEYFANAGIMLTNTFNLRPLANNWRILCGKRAEVPGDYNLPPIETGKYVLPKYLSHVERLRAELLAVRPNLIICLGNIACWAVLRATSIGSIRGNVSTGKLVDGKVLPTYHPAVIFRQWNLRPIVLMDLKKAWRQKDFPEIRRPQRWITVFPTFSEINAWAKANADAPFMAVDIETKRGQITDISFATSPRHALVISFTYGPSHPKFTHSVYDNVQDELLAWRAVSDILALPARKVFQNGLFDLQYLYRMRIYPRNCTDDTMLLHHSLFPEMKKGLGFLGSIYTDEASWKLMRLKAEEIKRDE